MTMPPEVWDAKAARVIEEFRRNGGVVGGEFEGYPLVILHTVDERGDVRENIVMYRTAGDRRVVFASHSGLPENPLWYGNLLARPTITIEIGDRTEVVRAIELHGPERDCLYDLQAAEFPDFELYRGRCSRLIPVLALVEASDPDQT